jgi:hypothetical protein
MSKLASAWLDVLKGKSIDLSRLPRRAGPRRASPPNNLCSHPGKHAAEQAPRDPLTYCARAFADGLGITDRTSDLVEQGAHQRAPLRVFAGGCDSNHSTRIFSISEERERRSEFAAASNAALVAGSRRMETGKVLGM